jgi:NAD(P)-dependent dehydrogenase (short-subunit alcohol dehydrogenase family)
MAHRVRAVDDQSVVVVTGASSGMGQDAALYLNHLGYTVAAGIRRPEEGDVLVAEAVEPARMRPLVLDVTDDGQVAAARSVVEGLVGGGLPFAGVFSNAGIAHFEGDTSSEGTPMSVLLTVMDVNFFGSVRFITAFLPLARATGACVVVNSALMAHTVLPFNGGYAASKCALEGWVDSLRREIAPRGVRVVLVEAAGISTGLVDQRDPDVVDDDNPYPEQRAFLQHAFASMDGKDTDPRCSPRRVSEIVAHALQAKRPRTRYVVGGGAHAIHALGSFPPTVQDRALERFVRSASS